MDAAQAARAYYRAIDAGDYETLADLLAASFVHYRPDMTIDGGDSFVRFMREERPQKDTTHAVEDVYSGPGGVAVRGTLSNVEGKELFAFVDVFEWEDGEFVELTTYT